VALNDTIMVFAFAPIVGLLLGLSAITVPWQTLLLSVVLYIVVPVVAAQLWRRALLARGGEPALAAMLRRLQPVSLVALLRRWCCCSAFRASRSSPAAVIAAARRADRDPGLSQCRASPTAEPRARRAAHCIACLRR
jgi:hypothetical protein